MGKTKIDWCDVVWNPVTGCTKVSEGCVNCYAERIAKRFWKDRPFSKIQTNDRKLIQGLRWLGKKSVFVNSMGDLFHPDVPFEYIDQVLAVIERKRLCKFMILTKRPARMAEYFRRFEGESLFIHFEEARRVIGITNFGVKLWPIPNLWLGVSVENQNAADERIPWLSFIPAAHRFVSAEPMLEPIDLRPCEGTNHIGLPMLDWVICGRETGPGARPFDPVWAMDLQKQCNKAGVPFWWKNHPEYQERPERI